jgi:1,2-phenylacetyl-CoA epoxidase catalytic subunit
MTTLKITVDNRKHAVLLTKLLKSMAFVKKVEEDLPVSKTTDQFVALKNIFNSIEPNSLFSNISDPVEWQKINPDIGE